MRQGFYDKLFFIDKLFDDWKSLLDFGCADGFHSKLLGKIYPTRQIIGYDKDPAMVQLARYNGEQLGNVRFTDEWQSAQFQDTILLSSVIHEVYNYCSPAELDRFWSLVFCPERKHVIIRDMVYDYEQVQLPPSPFIISAVKEFAAKTQTTGELERFEQQFGSLNDGKNLLHYLLKYLYVTCPNWSRELKENYLPLSKNQLLWCIPEGWWIQHEEMYTLPYLKYRWRQDFPNTDLRFKTHIKLIISRQTK